MKNKRINIINPPGLYQAMVLQLLALMLLFSGIANAQIDNRLKLQPRGDRVEGLTNLLDVSDDGLVLVSFKAVQNSAELQDSQATLHASFDLTLQGDVKINVMSFDVPNYAGHWYTMVKRGEYKSTGSTEYTWPASLVNELRISQKSMHVLTTLNRGGKRKIFPAIIHRGQFDKEIDGYAFTFWPRTLANVTASIVDVSAREVIWQKRLSSTLAYRPYTLTWDGTGKQGEQLANGAFILILKPGFHQLDGSIAESEPYVYHFDHTWTIRPNSAQN